MPKKKLTIAPTDASKQNDLMSDAADLQKYLNDFKNFLPLPVVSVTPFHIILDVNRSFQDIFKYNELEIIGMPVETIVAEDYLTAWQNTQKKILATDAIIKKEIICKTKTGKKQSFLLTCKQRRDENGTAVGYFIALVDISANKEQEKMLKEKIGQLELFKNSAIGRELRMVELKEKLAALEKKTSNEQQV
jgi:PAS domain S-box-containing protein